MSEVQFIAVSLLLMGFVVLTVQAWLSWHESKQMATEHDGMQQVNEAHEQALCWLQETDSQ